MCREDKWNYCNKVYDIALQKKGIELLKGCKPTEHQHLYSSKVHQALFKFSKKCFWLLNILETSSNETLESILQNGGIDK